MPIVGSGVIGPGQAEYVDVHLTGEVTYHIYVGTDEPGVDFDLYVYDENGNLVAVDTDPDSDALCTVTPVWSGPFRLVVKSERGGGLYYIRVET